MTTARKPRGGMAKEDPNDAQEERDMWSKIVSDMKKLKGIQARAKELTQQILVEEERINDLEGE